MKVGNNIQINQGLDITQSVFLAGFQFAGSSDTAVSLAIAARGIGQIIDIQPMLPSLNINDFWVSVAWQLTPTTLLYKLPSQKFNQQVYNYSLQELTKYFKVI